MHSLLQTLITLITPIAHAQEDISLNIPIPSTSGAIEAVTGLTQYVSVVFQFGVTFMTVVLTVTMMIAGALYVASAGVPGKVAFAKKLMKNTAVALLVILFSFVIISMVNPTLTRLTLNNELITKISPIVCCADATGNVSWVNGTCESPLTPADPIQCTIGKNLESEEEVSVPEVDVSNLSSLQGIHQNILIDQGVFNAKGTEDLKNKLVTAAQTLPNGTKMLITGALRTKEEQEALIKQNCPPAKGRTWSNPKRSSDCSPATALNVSAHMTGRAIDVWGYQNGKQCLYPQETNCPSNDPVKQKACRLNSCQRIVIEAMFAQGFCLMNNEAWHFETLENGKALSSGCKLKADFPELNEPYSNPTP